MRDPLVSARGALQETADTLGRRGYGDFPALLAVAEAAAQPLDTITTLAQFARGVELLDALCQQTPAARTELHLRLRAKGNRLSADARVLTAARAASRAVHAAVERLCPRLRVALLRALAVCDDDTLACELPGFLDSRFVLATARMIRLGMSELEPCLAKWTLCLAVLPATPASAGESFWAPLSPRLPEAVVYALDLQLRDWVAAALLGLPERRGVASASGTPCGSLTYLPEAAARAMRGVGGCAARALVTHTEHLCVKALEQAHFLHRLGLAATAPGAPEPRALDTAPRVSRLREREAHLSAAILGSSGIRPADANV